jgi:prepilin-type N-terminal cleavage/methylation domain-containing protein
MKNRNNWGYSLVELIVVVAIMAVLAGVSAISVGILSGKQAKETRDELKSKLENVRIQTMGKRTVTADLAEDASGRYVLTVTSTLDASAPQVTAYTLGGTSCKVYYSCNKDCVYTDGGADLVPVSGTGLRLEFDRSSGAMKELTGTTDYVYHIFVVQSGKVYGIRFYPETGKMAEE